MADKGATRQKDKCFTLNRMIEEVTAEEIEANSAKANSAKAVVAGRPKGGIPSNGNRTIIVPESTKKGGVISPDHPGVITHLNVGTVENMATMKRSAGKRRIVVPFGSGSLREPGGNHGGLGLGEIRIQIKASKE